MCKHASYFPPPHLIEEAGVLEAKNVIVFIIRLSFESYRCNIEHAFKPMS